MEKQEKCCFNCMYQSITDCTNGRFKIGCELGQVAFNECLGDIVNHFEPLENKYKKEKEAKKGVK